MKRKLIVVCMVLAMLLSMAGCTGMESKKEEKINISIYMWDKNMTKELTPWLEEQFPEINFTFVTGYNNMEYYKDLINYTELPDIITCRRFSLNDAAFLSDKLLDLSQTELVGSFYSNYIENNRETSGAIRWLPMCAEIDGIMANRDLFDQYGIPLPTNYAEFVSAIDTFEENGIRGFISDYSADYTCLELMQGSAIPELKSLEGMMWRAAYESETEDGQVGLDAKVWPVVFEKFARLLDDVRATPDLVTANFTLAANEFNSGQAAMMRATANDSVISHNLHGINAVMLPYFGETEADNWILTYPVFQVAVSKNVAESAEKEAAVMKVLEATFSEEGQRRVASGNAVLSYNKNVNIEMSDALSEVKDCIDRNHLYIRLASTEIFSVSRKVAQKMINDEYATPQEAYEEFNELLTSVSEAKEEEIVITQETAYDYTYTDKGSQAASSVLNTMTKGMNKEIGIGFANMVSTSVFAKPYTEQQIKWLIAFKAYTTVADYTGAEIIRLMEYLVNPNEEGNNPIRHKNMIPTTSGMEYSMKDNGDGTYTLLSVTINGEPVDENKTYSVLMVGEYDILNAEIYCNDPMPEDLLAKRQNTEERYFDCLINSVKELGQFEAPTDYVTITR